MAGQIPDRINFRFSANLSQEKPVVVFPKLVGLRYGDKFRFQQGREALPPQAIVELLILQDIAGNVEMLIFPFASIEVWFFDKSRDLQSSQKENRRFLRSLTISFST
jgi:hypothetical protein